MSEASATSEAKAQHTSLKQRIKRSGASASDKKSREALEIRDLKVPPVAGSIGQPVGKGVAIFQVRATRAVESLLAVLDPAVLVEAASAPTDVEVLVSALQQAAVLNSMLTQDPLAEAKLRGQLRRKELLEAEGGVLGPEQMGNLLGIQRQSVDKRRKAGTLLAVELGNRFAYPAWQIEGNSTLPHLEEVLEALKDHDEWRKLSFFVNGNVRLGGKSPLNALRAGQYNDVLTSARSLGEHGAA
jgi:hypothetical protein